MTGFITIDRTLMNHWCSSDPNFLAVWIWLLSDANWKDKKALINSCVVEIKRGQLIFGLNAFSKRSGVSVSKLRKIIDVLISEQMIDRLKTNKYSIITIANYNSYQTVDRQNASKQHSNNIQNATPKQDNNSNKVNNSNICVEKFETFWMLYPRKIGKAAAKRKYEAVIKNGNTPESKLLEAIKNQLPKWKQTEEQFIPHAATWINQGRWDDEVRYQKPSYQL